VRRYQEGVIVVRDANVLVGAIQLRPESGDPGFPSTARRRACRTAGSIRSSQEAIRVPTLSPTLHWPFGRFHIGSFVSDRAKHLMCPPMSP
jgi:hypothetical protein